MINKYSNKNISYITKAILSSLIAVLSTSCSSYIKPNKNKVYPYVGLVKHMKRYNHTNIFKSNKCYRQAYTYEFDYYGDTIVVFSVKNNWTFEQLVSKYEKYDKSDGGISLIDGSLYIRYMGRNGWGPRWEKNFMFSTNEIDTINKGIIDSNITYKRLQILDRIVQDTIINGIEHYEVRIYNSYLNKYKDDTSISNLHEAIYLVSKQYGLIEKWYYYEDSNEFLLFEELTFVEEVKLSEPNFDY